MPYGNDDDDILHYRREDHYFTDDATVNILNGQSVDITGVVNLNGSPVISNSSVLPFLPFVNVKQAPYLAKGDGVTDDTTAIQAAIDAVSAVGGILFFPAGTYIAAGLVVKSNVIYQGTGVDATFIKLKNGANTDLLVGQNFASLTGGTTTGGISGFKFADLTLDGNRANNTSGWVLRIYAFKYRMENVHIKNGKSGGVWTQWGTGGTNMEAHWSNFKIFNCEGVVLDHNGPHDSLFVNGTIFNDGTISSGAGITLGFMRGQSSGSQFTNVHFWGNCDRAVDVTSECYFANCQAEGALLSEVRFQSNFGQWIGGHIFGTASGTEIGVEFGVAAVTSAKGNYVNTKFSKFAAGSFPVKWANSAGSNVVEGQTGVSVTAAAVATGTPNTTVGSEDRVELRSSSPSALVTDWAIPKIQNKRIWKSAADMELIGGTPALAVVQSTPVWLFDAAVAETVGFQVQLPAWWNTFEVYYWWANAGAGAGDVVWALRYDFIAAGQTLGTYTSAFVTHTAGLQDVVVTSSRLALVTNVTDQVILVRVERNATNGADTLANDAELIGVEFVWIS